MGSPGDDRLALSGDRNELFPGQSPIVEFVQPDRRRCGRRRRRAQPGGRSNALVDLDVGRRVQSLGDSTDGVLVGVLRDVLAPDAGDADRGAVGFLYSDDVGRAAPKTSKPLPKFALVAGARTVTMLATSGRRPIKVSAFVAPAAIDTIGR